MPTRDGWFVEQTTGSGVWVIAPERRATMPYFELTGANLGYAQFIEDLFVTSSGNPNSILGRYLVAQGAVQPETGQTKTGADAGRGVYIRINFTIQLDPRTAAQVEGRSVSGYQRNQNGDAGVPLVAVDADRAEPDVVINMNSHALSAEQGLPRKERSVAKYNDGTSTWQASAQLDLLHELGHVLLDEGYMAQLKSPALLPDGTHGGFAGHSPFSDVRTRTGTDFKVKPADILGDPVEAWVLAEGKRLGLIANETKYLEGRASAYNNTLKEFAQANNLTTTQAFNLFLVKHEELFQLHATYVTARNAAREAARALARAETALDEADTQANREAVAAATAEKQRADAQAAADLEKYEKSDLFGLYTGRLENYQVKQGELTPAAAIQELLDLTRDFFGKYSSVIGQQLGSALGKYIARNESTLVQMGASTLLGVVGLNLGQAVELKLHGSEHAMSGAFSDLPTELKDAAIGAGVGAISSLLTAELFDELGIDGTAGELGQTVFSSYLTAIIQHLPALISGAETLGSVLGTVNIGNIVGGWIGAKLASELVEFDTVGGQIGSAVGAAVGGFIGGAIAGAKLGGEAGFSIWGPVGAAIGAFIGFIVGGLIGSLFGGSPRSGADLVFDQSTQRFRVASAWARHGASKDGARSIATGAANLINAVIEVSGARVVDPNGIRIGSYGTHLKNVVWRVEDATGKEVTAFKLSKANLVINYGTAVAIADLIPRLVGGDVFVKRALIGTYALAGIDYTSMQVQRSDGWTSLFQLAPIARAFDPNVVIGNISTAQDYAAYLQNRDEIDAYIAAEPTSAFTAGWAITFARAIELGLLKRAITDWSGGWNVFLDEKRDGVVDGQAFTAGQLAYGFDSTTKERLMAFFDSEGIVNVVRDTIDNAGKDVIAGTTAADVIVVANDRIANTAGLTINGTAATGAQHVIDIAARIQGGDGNDRIVAGDLGNDLLGGNGNDTLVGGKLDDWLLGDAGDDRLFAGAANHQFADGDPAATAAAVNTISNGDMLDGGEGDDALYGSRGSDWLIGGAGNDFIHGGAGGDIIDGGEGNDRGLAGEARLFGGGGTDQYVFGYGSGVDVAFDESDTDHSAVNGQDSIYARLQQIQSGVLARNWAGGGDYEVDGSVKGGEDAISFGLDIGLQDLLLQRSGNDLVISLTYTDPETHVKAETGDQLTIKDWFESTRRVEWLRFANGEEVRIGNISSFFVGTSSSDIIVGSYQADFLYGGAGDDVMYGLDGDDFGFGGAGNDLVAGDNDNDWVTGGLGDDKVMGGAGNDTVFGDSGNDETYGGAGSDIVIGGRGDDVVVGGSGDDIFRFERGDGRDFLLDNYVNNWDVVWVNGSYTNGYVLDSATGTVSKGGVVFFDGSQWIGGQYDFDTTTQTLRRHLGALSGQLVANSGTDYLEFGIGIDIQDLMLRRTGNNLEIAITQGDSDATPFDAVADRITFQNWSSGNYIENFVFVATGRHQVTGWNITGGSDGADTLTGGSAVDWITGNGGDDTIIGNPGNDILSGNAGSDLVRGGSGTDVLYGGAGDDVLEGGTEADTLVGGTGVDIASYVNAATANRNMRAFLGASHTNTFEGVGDTYTSIEGLEGTAGADTLGGDEGANVLRGAGGNDSLFGGAGDDIYEISLSHGQDVIDDRPFVTEEITNSAGEVNTALFSVIWNNTGYEDDGLGNETYYYELVVTHIETGEQVYHEYDFSFPYSLDAPPPASDWPDTWIGEHVHTGNGAQIVREVFATDEDGGEDTLEFGPDIGLSDLTIQRVNSGADLLITYRSGQDVTIRGQANANYAVESLQLADGLTANLSRLVLAGETASSEDDFLAGNSSANTLNGLAGDDVLSGAAGNDTLRGGDGDDVLEGGAGNDTLDGGTDSLSAGLGQLAEDQTGEFGDTIRYVRSTAAVTIDLAAGTAAGGHAAGDVIVAVSSVSTVENVVGSTGFGDTLRGDSRANRLIGLGGNDILDGRAGDDVLIGGVGNDQLLGGDGADNLAGQDGNDTLEGGAGIDLVAGGAGDDTLRGDAGEDVLTGADGVDQLYGGADNDQLGGDAGNDTLYGDAGNDRLAGGEGDDTLYGGDGDDEFAGEAGNDILRGELGTDTYYFDAASGSDTIIDASGANRIAIGGGVTREQVWLTRSGNDLVIRLIGASSVITMQGYYASTNATLVREIAVSGESLFLAHSAPLITAMTSAGAVPTAMPGAILELSAGYWHAEGRARPTVVADIHVDNSMGAVVSGSVGAVDHDDNIVSYQLQPAGTRGTVTLNETTGAWTYTPAANPSGEDLFQIQVTDAHGQTALQTIRMTLPADPADITIITLVQVGSPQAPLTKPTLDSGSWVVHIQASLTDNDTSEIIDLRVTGVPAGITFNTGTSLGNGVWSFGNGPWPTEIRGPATWSQDLSMSVTATAREIATGHTLTSDPVALNIEINARPTDITAGALAFDENTTAGTALTSLAAVDADASDTATYTLVNNAGGRFALSSAGQLSAGSTVLNYEAATTHTIRVQVTDSGGLTFVRDLAVTVRNVNEAPTVTNQAPSTNEDVVLSGSVGATDPDGNISSYALAVSATRGVVNLNTTTGAWTYTPNANLYGADSFQVRVTDVGGLSTVQTVNVNVISQNDAPTNITLTGAPATVAENDRPITGTVASAVVLGTLSATDVDAPDAGDFATHVFSVTDSRFEVVSGNVLRLRAGAVVDFEAGTSISVNVTVRDRNGQASGLTFVRQFTFTVADQDDYFYGTASADTITGTAGRNVISGQGGNDTLTGANANDLLDGGDGADTLSGLGGTDTLVGGLGDDILDGGTGNDTLSGGDGNDTLRGQDGNDTLNGEAGLDLLQGGAGDDQLDGGADNDRLEGGDANDRLVGGTGDDTLLGGAGADRFLGGAGTDTVSYEAAAAGITVDVTTITGSAGDATGDVFEDSIERIVGSNFGDTIRGSAANETLEGGTGNDTIYGGAGNDILVGGDGNDYLDAQSGNDTLNGGAGSDILIGGDDSDTYLMDINSGADEIRNFDPSGLDIDVVGYQNINRNQLWFERVGNDLIVSVIGTPVRTTVTNWYGITTASERANYEIDFFLVSGSVTNTINAEALVTLMAGYTRPTTQAQYDTLHANSAFENSWQTAWNLNTAPSVPSITAQAVDEDGTLTLTVRITDDITPVNGITVTAQAVRVDNNAVEDLRFVNAPTIGAPNAAGDRTLTVTTVPNASGQVAIRIRAVDAGGLVTEQIFALTVNAVADAPVFTVLQAVNPTAPLTKPTLASGAWSLNIQVALGDQDGSEVLDEIRIAGVPAGITFSAGTDLGGGVWRVLANQIAGLQVRGPATWSQDLALSMTATARETATGATRTSTAVPFNIVINARPTNISAPTLSFSENTAANTVLTTLTVTDADASDTATFSLVDNAGGRFTIDTNGTLRAGGTALNYESATSHQITVRVTDSGGLTYDQALTVSVTNVNEAPTDVALSASQVFENDPAGTTIGTLSRSDVDASDSATYTLVTNPGNLFRISSNLLQTNAALNFEAGNSYTVRVRITDGGGLSYERDFTIGVLNRNETPTVPTLSASQVHENDPAGTHIGTLGSSDVDAGDSLTYTLVTNPGNLFRISGNSLQTNVPLNYEAPEGTSYTVRVRVTDIGGLSSEQNFTISVLNRNEAPTDITAPALSVNENSPVGTTVGQLTRVDPESSDSFTFTRLPSTGLPGYNANEEFFDITAGGLLVTTNNPLNYERQQQWNVRIQVTDGAGNSYVEVFTVNVGNVNEVPVFNQSSVSVNTSEDTAVGGTAVASDPENNISSYSAHLNPTRGTLNLNASGGWTYTPYANLNGTDSFQVRVTDAGGLIAVQTVTINVAAVNDAPAFSAQSFSVSEAALGGGQTQVGTLSSSDVEGNAVSYSVVSGYGDYATFNSAFSLTPGTGGIFKQGQLSYATKNRYDVLVRATDSGGAYTDNWVTVFVAPNVAPTINWLADPNTTTYDVFIGTIQVYDPEGAPVTYEILESKNHVTIHHIFPFGWGQEWIPEDRDALATVDSSGRVTWPGFPLEYYEYEYGEAFEVYGNTGYFIAVARDSGGLATAQMRVNYTTNTSVRAPVVLDLDGDGVELVSMRDSSARFAMDDLGPTSRTGWVGADDALLALDRDRDGVIGHGVEISFTQDLEGATSDLEGLVAFDTNSNMSLDAGDERFAEFLVWQDRNQDGVSQQDELRSLNEAGIASLSLLRTLTDSPEGQSGNQISATTDFVRVDGSRGLAADVALEYQAIVTEVEMMPLESTESTESSDGEDIGNVDRSSNTPPAAVVPVPRQRRSPPPEDITTDPIVDGSAEPQPLPVRAPDAEIARPRPWRVADMKFDERKITPDEWSPEPASRAPAALHASLSSISRRRLQMIDAMAGFEPEGSAELALRPQRHVDSRTLELLTTVARTGSMG